MAEETRKEQEETSPKEQLGVEDVVFYIEKKISHQQELIQRREKRQAGPLVSPEKTQIEIDRLEKMKEAVAREEYRGVAAELQKDITAEENALTGGKQELTRELREDDKYSELKQKIMDGQEVLTKVTDERSRKWVEEVINNLKAEQERTERGSVLKRMEHTQARIDHLQALHKIVSTPTPAGAQV